VIDTSAVTAAMRPTTSTLQQWWVLTVRVIAPTLRNGEVLTQASAPIMFTIGFYIPLKQMMSAVPGMGSYAQYLMPMTALTAVSYAAVSAAFRSATDAVQGINRRFRAMPIAPLLPLTSRMSASMYRCVMALVVSLACGHVIGFRFYGGVVHTVGFCLLILLIGAALSMLGDLIGVAYRNPEATVPLLLLPQVLFGLLSVGIQPVERFPEWIRPIVRDQPTSQFVYALRQLTGDSPESPGQVTSAVLLPALAWLVGLTVVAIPLHALLASRRR
jgi:ABC-2 type transport system permease protein